MEMSKLRIKKLGDRSQKYVKDKSSLCLRT